MSNFVFVLDTNKQPLEPCSPTIAKKLLKAGKAAVFRVYPFTIILKKAIQRGLGEPVLKTGQSCGRVSLRRELSVGFPSQFVGGGTPLKETGASQGTGVGFPHSLLNQEAVDKKEIEQCQLKLDPGSKTTGIAILQGNKLIWVAELAHRGQQIKDNLESRRSLRRGRRARKTRYREPRFLNRTREKGWLPPSLEHRVLTTMTWVKRIIKLCPIDSIATELARFDTQKLQNPEISGTEYQQGTLYQYEVKEYLLEKFNRTCVYCGAKDTPLEVEHIKPKSKGGSNRVSNLTIACVPCNQAKSNLDIGEFLANKPSVLKRVLATTKTPLKDAAAVNSTRWKLFNNLKEFGLSVATGTGGQTKFNRTQQELPKRHYLDAAMVSDTPKLEILTNQPLLIKCTGHGNRQMCGTNKYGFPTRHKTNQKVHEGFQTGDIIKAVVTKGKKIGTYTGRVLCRASGSFDISTPTGRITGINHKYCFHIHKKDGYQYSF